MLERIQDILLSNGKRATLNITFDQEMKYEYRATLDLFESWVTGNGPYIGKGHTLNEALENTLAVFDAKHQVATAE